MVLNNQTRSLPRSRAFAPRRLCLGALAIGLIIPAQVAAQDWDLAYSQDGVATAAIEFDSGITLGFRCKAGSFAGMVIGLPAVAAPPGTLTDRDLQMSWAEGELIRSGTWFVASDPSSVLTDSPAPLARSLRRGGQLVVSLPGAAENGGTVRYILTIPPSEANLDQVLQACDRPLTDPQDSELIEAGSGLPGDIRWLRMPSYEYPSSARWNGGRVRLSCLTTPTGSLSNCVAESEFPENAGFARAALRGVSTARVASSEGEDAPVPVRVVSFVVRFSLLPPDPRGPGHGRLPRRDPRR